MKKNSRSQMLLSALMVGTALCGGNQLAWAQNSEELDLEIYVVDEDATPEEVINRISLPAPATAEIPAPPVGDSLEPLRSATDSTLDTATRTVTETINDAISSGDITKLPPEVDELVPDEVIDQIIDGVEIDLPGDLTAPGDTLNDTVDSLEGALPDVPAQIDSIDAAIDDLEADLDTPEIQLPELEQTIESLPQPEVLPTDETPVDPAVDDALDMLEDSAENSSPAADDLVPDLLNP